MVRSLLWAILCIFWSRNVYKTRSEPWQCFLPSPSEPRLVQRAKQHQNGWRGGSNIKQQVTSSPCTLFALSRVAGPELFICRPPVRCKVFRFLKDFLVNLLLIFWVKGIQLFHLASTRFVEAGPTCTGKTLMFLPMGAARLRCDHDVYPLSIKDD